MPVRQPAFVQHLQQHVENIRVCLLYLIKEDDGVRAAADRFGELTAGFVADVSRRGTDEAGDGVLLPILGHVDANDRVFVIEEKLGQRLR